MTLLHKNTLPMILVLIGSLGLAACSSKPAPWAESSSPWDNRAEQGEQADAAETIDPAPLFADEMVEPAGMMAMEQGAQAETVEPMILEPMIEPVAEPAMVEESAPVVMSGSLAQQPANYYAVQVVASSTMKQLSDFARANQLSEDWVAETMVNGKTWYVLMLGVYPSKAEAEQAMLSVQGLETQPWIRSVGSIQAVMN